VEFVEFDSLRAELRSLDNALARVATKTVRLESLRERFRTLFRVWASIVEPALRPYCQSKKEFFKLAAEVERLAQLASKFKPVADYRRRVRDALALANSLVLYLPSWHRPSAKRRHRIILSQHTRLARCIGP
jgi:hypothetical protein